MNLFENNKKIKTLSEFLRPLSLDDVIGQEHLLDQSMPLRNLIETNRFTSIILFGPPGSGKTTIGKICANIIKAPFIQFNASICGVNDIKNTILKYIGHSIPLIFIDEFHRFNKAQQDVLLSYIENNDIKFIGATTHNPIIYINKALRSRSMIFELKHISSDKILSYLDKIINTNKLQLFIKEEFNIDIDSINMDNDAKKYIASCVNGDIRILLNILENLLILKLNENKLTKNITISFNDIKQILPESIAYYDKNEDEHYNTISAFIKSVRGSDVQASIYYLAKMINSNEDPTFIARRLIILASEDIGMADPRALQVACNALYAVENIGMPEARIILSYATIYLALAPKSNSAYLAIEKALQYCKNNPNIPIPDYLKGININNSKTQYKYPHDYPNHYVPQRYMLCDEIFYESSNIGYEAKINNYLKEIINKNGCIR